MTKEKRNRPTTGDSPLKMGSLWIQAYRLNPSKPSSQESRGFNHGSVNLNVATNANTALREATMEIRHADLQIEVEDAEDGGVLLTIIDSARLSLSLPRRTARELLDAIDACMKTGERQTTDSVDVWRTADDLPLFGMHVGIDGVSWTCGAVRSRDVDGLADELEALLA